MASVVHKIRASECGDARAADQFTPSWPKVTCASCLQKRPAPAHVPPEPPEIAPPRVPTATPFKCVDSCGADLTCYRCNRCDEHCRAKAPNDPDAHKAWEDAWVKTIRGPKKRRP
jgi:hypothetical protein